MNIYEITLTALTLFLLTYVYMLTRTFRGKFFGRGRAFSWHYIRVSILHFIYKWDAHIILIAYLLFPKYIAYTRIIIIDIYYSV